MHRRQNASKGKELTVLKYKTGTRTDMYKLAMGEFRLKAGGIFLELLKASSCYLRPPVRLCCLFCLSQILCCYLTFLCFTYFLTMAFLLLQIVIWISSILLFSNHICLVRCKHLLLSQKKGRVRYNTDLGGFISKTRK